MTSYLPYIGGWYRWVENGVSQNTINYVASNDLISVYNCTANTNIKTLFSGKLVSSGISNVVIASVHSKKTCLKKLMKKLVVFSG